MVSLRVPALCALLGLSTLLGACVAAPLVSQTLSGAPAFAKQAASMLGGQSSDELTKQVAQAPQ